MLGIQYLKTSPIDYVILFKNGKIKAQGRGLSFFYYSPSSSIVIVPAASSDAPFIFKEATVDFQEINIQGQFTFTILDPVKLAGLLDFTVDSYGQYKGDGVEKLPVRLTNLIQVTIREKLSAFKLREALTSGSSLVEYVKERLKSHTALSALGVEILDFSILKISPAPEMSRALEASARESLLKEADDAIYQRRNFAVEQERKIKENELQTQIAVEEKNRKIREEQMNIEIAVQEKKKLLEEKKMDSQKALELKKIEIEEQGLNASIQLEEKRKQLVENQARNMIELSRAKGEALKQELSAISGLSPQLLDVLAINQMDSSKIISRALRDIAQNAGKIGNLNISPDLLTSLTGNKNQES